MSADPCRIDLLRGLVSTLIATPVLAQGPEWTYRQGGVSHGVHFHDSTHGILAEDGGRIRYWDSISQAWIQSATPEIVREDLLGAFVLSESLMWAVGKNGTVLRSIDGGVSFQLPGMGFIPVGGLGGNSTDLFDILMVSATDGFVVGTNGVVKGTTDGGEHWASVGDIETAITEVNGIEDPDDPYDIKILPNGWMVVPADWGGVYRSKNGGATWTLDKVQWCGPGSHPYLALWMVDFLENSLEGWLVGGVDTNGGMLYHTLDGGDNWEAVTQLAPSGWTGPCSGPTPLAGGLEANATQYSITAFEPCTSSPAGALSGGYGSLNYLWHDDLTSACVWDLCDDLVDQMTTSSGPYWEQVNPLPTGLIDTQPAWFGAHSLKSGPDLIETWLCGELGAVRYSNDRGQSWTEQGSVEVSRFLAGSFYDDQNGLAVGQGRLIKRTTDGGVTMNSAWPQAGSGFVDKDLFGRDIAISDQGHGVVVGERWISVGGNNVKSFDWTMVTSDFGASWTDVTSSLPNLSALPVLTSCYARPGSDDLYVAGASGYVAFSPDGGTTWINRSIPAGTWVNDIVFTGPVALGVGSEPHVGFAVGKDLAAQITYDNGLTWARVLIGAGAPNVDLNGVDCKPDGSEAWAVGGQGLVLKRTANRFVPQSSGMAVLDKLNDVDEIDGTVAVCGDNGRMLLRSSGTWVDQKSQTSTDLYSIDFQSASHGFVVGRKYYLAEFE